MRALRHPNETSRLRALRLYDVLDTPREKDFDDIVALAAQICETPISVVNLIDKDRQWFKAEVGLGVRETPLETSICAHAILQKGIVEVADTTLDARFQDNPLVMSEPRLRFYAGALLETEDGLPLGTLCVLDTVPRKLTSVQRKTLEVLGRQVMIQLELRRKVRDLEQANIDRRLAEARSVEDRDFVRLVTDRLPVRIAYVDREYRYRFVNDAYERQLGLKREQVLGGTIAEVVGEEIFVASRHLVDRCLSGEAYSVDVELPYLANPQWVHATYVPDFGPSAEVRGAVIHILDITDRREMERELASERASQDHTLEIAQVGVWRLDLANNQAFGNKILQTFFNITEESIRGGPQEPYMASVHPDDRARVAAAMEASIATGTRYEVEYRVTGSDGQERWLLARGNANLGNDGKAHAFSGIVLDVTERVSAQEAVRESELQRRRALDSAGIGAWNIDLATLTLTSDERFREIFSGEGAPLSYEEAFGLIHSEDRQMVRDRVEAACLPNAAPYAAEYRVVHADGSIRWVFGRGSANFVDDHPEAMPVSLDGTVLDITERKIGELEREILAQQVADLADTVDQLVWMADASGWINWYNRRWYAYTGKTPEEMEGWGWQSVHDPAVLPQVLERWAASISTGQPFEMEFPIRRSDGVFRSFLTRANPIKDIDGNVLRWFGTNTDIQSRKDMEAELERRVAERTSDLTRANRDLNEFSYGVAHDLRSPLRAIASTSGILLEDNSENLRPVQRDLLTRQAKSAVRLAGLVDDLLAFGRLTSTGIKKQDLDLTSIAKTLTEENLAGDWVTPCSFHIQEGMRARGDQQLVTYALTNLVDNACKFSPNGGSVTIGALGNRFFVRDEGIGFNMAYAQKIFVAFERLVAQDDFEGTGVGLAMVKRIVESHGGTIWAESEPGKGSTFWFSLADFPDHDGSAS